MHFIIYETTCKINGKKYRGAHVCENLNDTYLGSGILLKKAIAKYGFDSFERVILKECSSIKEMFECEAKFVDHDWVSRRDTYNLKIGGEGGWDYINKNGIRWTNEKRKAWSIKFGNMRRTGKIKPLSKPKGMLGMKHSAKSKKLISENNAMTLDDALIKARQDDIIASGYPNRGSITKLSKLWNVSHTQVSRFIQKHPAVA